MIQTLTKTQASQLIDTLEFNDEFSIFRFGFWYGENCCTYEFEDGSIIGMYRDRIIIGNMGIIYFDYRIDDSRFTTGHTRGVELYEHYYNEVS